MKLRINMIEKKLVVFFCFSQLKIENLNGKKNLVLIKEMMLILNVFDKNDQNLLYNSFFKNLKKFQNFFFLLKRFFEKKFIGEQKHKKLIIIINNLLII